MENTIYRKLDKSFTLADRKKKYNDQLADQFIILVESHFRIQKTLEFYASVLGVNTHILAVSVQQRFNKSPTRILKDHMTEELTIKLRTTEIPIKRLAYEYGFRSFSQFTRFIKSMTGMTPTRYRALKCLGHH